jgi:digeranylgeranylglycerophospholipid reductase
MKVAIVGAGVNGLYLAQKLSRMGEDVTVFEKKDKIGKEACSGLFSEKILDFIPESEKLVKNKIGSVLIRFPKKTLKVSFLKKFFVMEHVELDRLAADLARKAGAKINLNSPINYIPENFDRVIGSDGAFSKVRSFFTKKDFKMRIAIQGFLPQKDCSDFVETWPTKNGFLWRIPRGENIEYGAIEKPGICQEVFEEFIKKNGLRLENIKSAPVPYDFFIPKNEKVTLCGDAAGLVKPWSGGGVIWGLTAADMLLKNFPDLIKYYKAVKLNFYTKVLFSRVITGLVYFFGFKIPWILPSNFKIEGDFIRIFNKNVR